MPVVAAIAPEAWVALVLGLLLGALGWRAARRFRARHGTAQWGAPPWLWGLLFFFSWLIGVVLISVAGSATQRDLSATSADPAARIPRRARTATAVALFVLGLAAIVGGAVELVSTEHADLAGLTVAEPTPGMVATATGAGGAVPTQILPGASTVNGIAGVGNVPTTPTIYLKPATTTNYGIATGSESAYWKVWWDGGAQQKDVVSLQQHLDAADATEEVSLLDARNSNPAVFANSQLTFTSVGTFTVPGIDGATGNIWSGREGTSLHIQFRFLVFSRGSVVALVSTTAYGGSADASAFQAFALAEYDQMGAASTSTSNGTLFGLLAGIGVGVVLAGVISVVGATYRPRPVTRGAPGAWQPGPWMAPGGVPPAPWASPAGAPPPPAPAPAPAANAGWYPDPGGSEPGVLRYWDGWRWTPATTKPRPPE